jgi:hypothetical protein
VEVRFHSEALAELVEAMDWYGLRSHHAKESFLDEFELAVARIREAPLRWPTYLLGTRKVRLRRFPFALVYDVGVDVAHVVAVAHLHRRPGYWRGRRDE